ncbi:MAG: toll/interleukin-1 receptor domain-containing protein [Planctomycetota bacterium]
MSLVQALLRALAVSIALVLAGCLGGSDFGPPSTDPTVTRFSVIVPLLLAGAASAAVSLIGMTVHWRARTWTVLTVLSVSLFAASMFLYSEKSSELLFRYPPEDRAAPHYYAGDELTSRAKLFSSKMPKQPNGKLVDRFGGLERRDVIWRDFERTAKSRGSLLNWLFVSSLTALASTLAFTVEVLIACGLGESAKALARRRLALLLGARRRRGTVEPGALYSCFISYSWKDRQLVEPIVADLERHGADVWFDKPRLKWSERFSETIRREIRQRDRYLLFATEHSLKSSDWVRHELETAVREEKRREQVSPGTVSLVPIDLDGHLQEWDHVYGTLLRERLVGSLAEVQEAEDLEAKLSKLREALRRPPE